MKTVDTPEVPVKGAQLWPLTIPAYRALGEASLIPRNTELLYGQVYQKLSKSPLHSALVRRLLKMLRQISIPGRFISSEQPIACGDSEPEPDVSIVRGEEDDFLREHPTTADLVIEVCVSSHDYDRSKLRAYASAGIKEVWLALAPEKQIEIHSQPTEHEYRQHSSCGPGGKLVCAAVPEFTLDLDAFFAK